MTNRKSKVCTKLLEKAGREMNMLQELLNLGPVDNIPYPCRPSSDGR